MNINIIIMLIMFGAIILLGVFMSISVSKYEKNKQTTKKKKGRMKYMPEVKSNKFK